MKSTTVTEKIDSLPQLYQNVDQLSQQLATANLSSLAVVLKVRDTLEQVQEESEDIGRLLNTAATANPYRKHSITTEKSLQCVKRETETAKRLLRRAAIKYAKSDEANIIKTDLQLVTHSVALALYELYRHLRAQTEPVFFIASEVQGKAPSVSGQNGDH